MDVILYTIGQLANAAVVNVETIRYYERRGLVEQPGKPTQGFRRYPVTTLNRLRFIKRAQELGFTLEEIHHLLTLNDTPCQGVQDVATLKLANVRSKIADLQSLELVLHHLLNQCASNPDQTHCPIIESLQPHNN
ncbi:Hg(II)-responsive transcriptional regulator [Rheinheimera sp. F8]|jgi:MerR family transcriptional regulator, mercuric resistance operon regulatory protein|uniref:Hg(II)-responsive transcriptional regulator n=1 Tax=Rheinheimera sp. F8 TaxID=1763998 RepID=UPI000744900A|nr:Hg(II)-responsive transcriptional regulator [Rheinheimera sp. F8]ALZ74782.1 MerR family transcriptional regulator [Rheinheimera sp. F8]